MSEENEGMLIYMDGDGTFREYDQRNDIVIHCDSEEDRKYLMNKLKKGLNSEWTPCSERLPKEDGMYTTTLSGELIGMDEPFVGQSYFEYGYWEDDGDYVIAWMPLPEPYKENEDEGQADT